MAILETVLTALVPYLIDMIVDIIKAEEDPELDTGYKKHDYVMQCLDKNVGVGLKSFDNRDIMDTANHTIRQAVKKLNKNGVFKKG